MNTQTKQPTYKKLPGSQIQVELTIKWSDIEKKLAKVCQDYSQKNPLPGYRAGKAPQEKVLKKIGEQEAIKQAVELAMKQELTQFMVKREIIPISPPHVKPEQAKKGQDLKFQATITQYPEIELPDLTANNLGVKPLKLDSIAITDEQVNQTIDRIRKARAKYITVNRAAKKGDRVEINYQLFMGKVPYQGGSGQNQPLIIGDQENRFLPEFEKNLIGLKAGDKKKFSVKFPEKYHDQKLQGKQGEFEVEVKIVQKVEMPKLDQDFVKSIGDYQSVQDFKKVIKQNLKADKKKQTINQAINNLISKIVKKSSVSLPDTLIKEEKQNMLRELEENLKSMGLDLDSYLKHLKTSKEKILEAWDQEAKQRIITMLAIQKISQNQNIKATASEIKTKKEFLKNQKPELVEKASTDQIKRYAENIIVNEKTIQWLKNKLLTPEE
ncbi:MAG: trigger factor [Candidatus Moranbacteria bacterium]|nr:trigger factor [Candidatus Moranbacteria bacterium]